MTCANAQRLMTSYIHGGISHIDYPTVGLHIKIFPCCGKEFLGLYKVEEKEEMIQEVLNKVPLGFRTALVLKDIEGLSYNQISQVLGCSIGMVESKIYSARIFLKKELLRLEGETK